MARVFLELLVQGSRRVLIEPSQIAGIITSGPSLDDSASPERPLSLLIRGFGETVEVYGTSAHMLLAKMDRVSVNNKAGHYDLVVVDGERFNRDTVVIYLDGADNG